MVHKVVKPRRSRRLLSGGLMASIVGVASLLTGVGVAHAEPDSNEPPVEQGYSVDWDEIREHAYQKGGYPETWFTESGVAPIPQAVVDSIKPGGTTWDNALYIDSLDWEYLPPERAIYREDGLTQQFGEPFRWATIDFDSIGNTDSASVVAEDLWSMSFASVRSIRGQLSSLALMNIDGSAGVLDPVGYPMVPLLELLPTVHSDELVIVTGIGGPQSGIFTVSADLAHVTALDPDGELLLHSQTVPTQHWRRAIRLAIEAQNRISDAMYAERYPEGIPEGPEYLLVGSPSMAEIIDAMPEGELAAVFASEVTVDTVAPEPAEVILASTDGEPTRPPAAMFLLLGAVVMMAGGVAVTAGVQSRKRSHSVTE